jgi:IS30 family transposase
MAKNITYEERCTIGYMLNASHSVDEIQICLKRSTRTLKRELSRCEDNQYVAITVQSCASQKMCRRQELHLTTAAKDYINDKLVIR